MSFLLDTNVISDLVALSPDPSVTHVTRWLEGVDQESIFLSVITIGELKRSIDKLLYSKRKRILSDWLTGDLLICFGDRILTIDIPVILKWGTLVASIEAKG
jgi:predicted nucleic acid-binding protein